MQLNDRKASLKVTTYKYKIIESSQIREFYIQVKIMQLTEHNVQVHDELIIILGECISISTS